MVDDDGSQIDHSALPDLPSPSPPRFLEVSCKSSRAIRRFAPGTNAGFAVSVINRKLNEIGDGADVNYIEAVRDGEEPICFGPGSVLLDYGAGWTLQTVTEQGAKRRGEVPLRRTEEVPQIFRGLHSAKRTSVAVPNLQYFAKILLAFVLIFVLGAIFTLALEYLPTLLMLIQS